MTAAETKTKTKIKSFLSRTGH